MDAEAHIVWPDYIPVEVVDNIHLAIPADLPSFEQNFFEGWNYVTSWDDDGSIGDHAPLKDLIAQERQWAIGEAYRYWMTKKSANRYLQRAYRYYACLWNDWK